MEIPFRSAGVAAAAPNEARALYTNSRARTGLAAPGVDLPSAEETR
jgi:hypothetical protein